MKNNMKNNNLIQEEINRAKQLSDYNPALTLNEQSLGWTCEQQPGSTPPCQCVPAIGPLLPGQYQTQQDCMMDQGNCCHQGLPQWWCIGGVAGMSCIQSPTQPGPNASGPFNTQQDCMQSPNCATPQTYACNNGMCIPAPPPLGNFTTLADCQQACGGNQWWCQGGFAGPVGCFQSPTNPGGTTTGPYQSQAHCSNLCSQSQNTWKCKNIGSHPKFGKKCAQVQPGQGDFATKQECVDSGCQGIGPDISKDREVNTNVLSGVQSKTGNPKEFTPPELF